MKLNFVSRTGAELPFIEDRRDYHYAIVKHRTNREGLQNLTNAPDTIPLQDKPFGDLKGNTIPISARWWDHIRKINSPGGYAYARSIGNLWINIDYTQTKTTPRAESVICGGNIVAWKEETYTHVKLISFPNNYDAGKLLPQFDNWQAKPWLFWKACSINKAGDIFKVASALDVYYPLIANTDLWIRKIDLELFPSGYDYRFSGCNVYDNERPLMTISGNQRTFYNGFFVNTKSVIP